MKLSKKKYAGIIIPMVTPLTPEFSLDHAAVEKLFSVFYENNVLPFILGTTGEASSLPFGLKNEYIKLAVKLKKPGTILYAGISGNCLAESIEFVNRCFDEGIDVVAATLPSYFALTESQMKKYFEQLADRVSGPIIIYNIPATTHMSIPLDIIDELSTHSNIVGTKDSERSDERLHRSLSLWSERPDFSHFLGWAARSAEALFNGSDGLVPSTGNLYPSMYSAMLNSVEQGEKEGAYHFQKLSDVLGNLYQQGKLLGESLSALKLIMNNVGFCGRSVMPPLQVLSDQEEKAVLANFKEIMETYSLRF